MEPICGEQLPVDGALGLSEFLVFDCTLAPKHEGRHEAYDSEGNLLVWWEDGCVLTVSSG